MGLTMHYQRPETSDFGNVKALNRAFLGLLSGSSTAPVGSSVAADELVARIGQLTAEESTRLASCPFLIFSLAEHDTGRWQRLFDTDVSHDLVDAMQRPPEAYARLAAASVGFLWELSRRNAYAARLVCGASIEWCERLASSTPIRLVQFASNEPGLLSPRFAARKSVWQKLLGAGTSPEEEIRCAAHIAALQVMLTTEAVAPYRPMASAACKTAIPVLRVAEQRSDSRKE